MQLVEYYLSVYLHDNAIFFAERLVDVSPSETNRHLLATAYVHAGRHRQAVTVLRPCKASYNVYLLAHCLIKTEQYAEADERMMTAAGLTGKTGEEQVSELQKSPYKIPNGAAGAHLVGVAAHLGGNMERGSKFYMLALYLDPYLFTTFEALCRHGYMPEPAQTFVTRRLAPDGGLSHEASRREYLATQREAEEKKAAEEAAKQAAALAAAGGHLAGRKRSAAGHDVPITETPVTSSVAGGAPGGAMTSGAAGPVGPGAPAGPVRGGPPASAAAAGYMRGGIAVPTPLASPITPAVRLMLTGAMASGHPHSAYAPGSAAQFSASAGGASGLHNFSSLSGSMLQISSIASSTQRSGIGLMPPPQPHFGDTGAMEDGEGEEEEHEGNEAPGSDDEDGGGGGGPAPASPGIFDVSAISAGPGGGQQHMFFNTYKRCDATAGAEASSGASNLDGSLAAVTPISGDTTAGSDAIAPGSAIKTAPGPGAAGIGGAAGGAMRGGLPPTAAPPRRQQRRIAHPPSAVDAFSGVTSSPDANSGGAGDGIMMTAERGHRRMAAHPSSAASDVSGGAGRLNGTILNFDSAPRGRPLEHVHPAFRGVALPSPIGPAGDGTDGGDAAGRGQGGSLLSPVPSEHQSMQTRLMNRLLGGSLSMTTPAPTLVDGAGATLGGGAEMDGQAAMTETVRRASAFATPATLMQRRLMMARTAASSDVSSGIGAGLSTIRPPPRARNAPGGLFSSTAGPHGATPGTSTGIGVPAFRLPPHSAADAASAGGDSGGTTAVLSPSSGAIDDDNDVDAGAADATPGAGAGASPSGGGVYSGPVGPAAIIMAHKAKRPRARLPPSGAAVPPATFSAPGGAGFTAPPSAVNDGSAGTGTVSGASGAGIGWGAATRRATKLDFGATGGAGDVSAIDHSGTPLRPTRTSHAAMAAGGSPASTAQVAAATTAAGGGVPLPPTHHAGAGSAPGSAVFVFGAKQQQQPHKQQQQTLPGPRPGPSLATPSAGSSIVNSTTSEPPREGLSSKLQEGGQAVLALLKQLAYVVRHLCRVEGKHALGYIDAELSDPHRQPYLQRSGYLEMLRGRAYCDAGDFRKAADAFKRMREVQPERVAGLEYLSTALWHLKAVHQLAALAHSCLDSSPDAWQTWVVVGNGYSAQRDHASAAKALRKASALGRHEAYPHTLCGHELMALGRMDEAAASFRVATEREGRSYMSWHGLGAIYFRQEDLTQAEYHFRKACEINRRSATLQVYHGMALAAQKKYPEALEVLNRASNIDPANPQAMYQRAMVHVAQRDHLAALAELQAVREVAPREPGVLVALGKALRQVGRMEDAVAAWNAALSLTKTDKDALVIRNLLTTAATSDGDESLIF